MFHCRVCDEKEKRVDDLKEQITYLRNSLNPPDRKFEIPHQVELQEDMLLDGGGKEETELLSDAADTPEVLAERAAMLSGTY